MKKINLAVIGASGLVGRMMLKVLAEYNIPINKLYLFGSERSAGKKVDFKNESYEILKLTREIPNDIDFALFSAGGDISREYATLFAEKGSIVIDNSSAWRMNESCPLVVPEVNLNHITNNSKIIANPNCSTIQMVLPLKALQDKYGLKRVIVSTYQSISGAGQKGINKLMNELDHKKDNTLSKHPIAFNTIFHSINENVDDTLKGYSEEEIKMILETKKILSLPNLAITATCVRLPILGGHGESLNIELQNEFELNELCNTLANFEGITLINENINEEYPTVELSNDKDDVFIGRIRRDNSKINTVNMWLTADNLRKGAASNAVQILQKLLLKK